MSSLKLIVVKPLPYAEGYVLAKQIGAEVYEVLTDAEARQLGLEDNGARPLSASMSRLIHGSRAGATGAPWARPRGRDG